MKKLIAYLIFSFPLLLRAQNDSLISYWNTTFHIGFFASGIPKHLEEAMRTNGFGQPSSGLWGLGAGQYPISEEIPVLQLSIERITKRIWSGKLLLSYMKGHVYSFSAVHGDFGITYNLNTASFLLGIHSKRRITRFAIGPALHFITIKTDAYSFFTSSTIEKITDTKAGFVMEAGVRFPARRSRMFFDLNTQYQFTGKQYFGNYYFNNIDSIGQIQVVSFEAGRKSFSYLSFNFGIGVRFGKRLK